MEKNIKYPRIIDTDYPNIYQKVFETSDGNQEFCQPTGRMLERSPDISDHWFEYVDSNGDYHYGR